MNTTLTLILTLILPTFTLIIIAAGRSYMAETRAHAERLRQNEQAHRDALTKQCLTLATEWSGWCSGWMMQECAEGNVRDAILASAFYAERTAGMTSDAALAKRRRIAAAELRKIAAAVPAGA